MIPLLIAGAAALAAAVGISKGKDGVEAILDARRVVEDGKLRHKRHVDALEVARTALKAELDLTTADKKRHAREALGRTLELRSRLEQRGSVKEVLFEKGIDIQPEQVAEFRGQYIEAGGVLTGAIKSVALGAGTAAVTTSLIGTFATASTGAAISGLAGAAAESAVLAWLGGGALAAGGGGMALGGVVLAGVAIGPALALGGFVLAVQGEKARTQAMEFDADVRTACSKMELVVALLRRGCDRASEVRLVLNALRGRVDAALDVLGSIAEVFDRSSDTHVAAFARAMLLSKAMSQLIRAPILDENGELHQETTKILAETWKVMEGPQ